MEYKEPTQPKPDMTFIDIHLKFGSCVEAATTRSIAGGQMT